MSARPLYETAGDLFNESAVAEEMAIRWRCEFVKLPVKSKVDFALVREKRIVAFAEVKCRKFTYGFFERLGFISHSLDKWTHALSYCEAGHVPYVLLEVLGEDGLFYARFMPGAFAHGGIEMFGRNDRGDWQDVEPCVRVPIFNYSRVSAA